MRIGRTNPRRVAPIQRIIGVSPVGKKPKGNLATNEKKKMVNREFKEKKIRKHTRGKSKRRKS